MKATGIVRRIDDLGRVVIPKEIRRTQLIRVGDPLEIFVSGAGRGDLQEIQPHRGTFGLCRKLCGGALQSGGASVAIADRDRVVACGRSSAGRR